MGLAIGPTLGSFIYGEVKYLYTFIIFGGLLLIAVVPVFLALPKRLNNGYEDNHATIDKS